MTENVNVSRIRNSYPYGLSTVPSRQTSNQVLRPDGKHGSDPKTDEEGKGGGGGRQDTCIKCDKYSRIRMVALRGGEVDIIKTVC